MIQARKEPRGQSLKDKFCTLSLLVLLRVFFGLRKIISDVALMQTSSNKRI